jgi:hypothetical protein
LPEANFVVAVLGIVRVNVLPPDEEPVEELNVMDGFAACALGAMPPIAAAATAAVTPARTR